MDFFNSAIDVSIIIARNVFPNRKGVFLFHGGEFYRIRKVPKDLTKIKSKMLFGLTKRQLVCFGSAALVGVPLFFLSKGSMGTTSAALCMILVMLPFFLFALYEKNGQTPEVDPGTPDPMQIHPSEAAHLSDQQRLFRPGAAGKTGKGGTGDC